MASSSFSVPEPLASIPRYPLILTAPSPIHHLPRLSSALSPSSKAPVQIFAKRDDLNSALAFGGNKTRKLEYLVAEALSEHATHLLSIGGVQSNHTRQVAAAAAVAGLKCILLQEHWVDWDSASYEKAGNIQLSRMMGADVRVASKEENTFGIEHKDTLKKAVQEVEQAGGKPYYIPAGASDHPLGGLGFARWAFEVAAQEMEMGIFFDTVVVCAVTGSTMAGMVAGFKYLELKLGGRKRRVLGIDASAKPAETKAQVLRIAKFTAAKIGMNESDITEADVELDERYHAGTYGLPDNMTVEAMDEAARLEAFITDPVYEGKSLAGMMDMVRKEDIKEGNVLYAHLGGQLALNAYMNLKEVLDKQK